MKNDVTNKGTTSKISNYLGVATSAILVLIITPWNIPILITEDVTVIAATNDGCVAESILNYSVIVSNCEQKVDVISVIFYVPAMEKN